MCLTRVLFATCRALTLEIWTKGTKGMCQRCVTDLSPFSQMQCQCQSCLGTRLWSDPDRLQGTCYFHIFPLCWLSTVSLMIAIYCNACGIKAWWHKLRPCLKPPFHRYAAVFDQGLRRLGREWQGGVLCLRDRCDLLQVTVLGVPRYSKEFQIQDFRLGRELEIVEM